MVRKMKNMNGLELLLSAKRYSIKDFYSETILMICHSFLIDYLRGENSIEYNNDIMSKEDATFIKEKMEEIFKYLEERIITYPAIMRVMQDSNKSSHNLLKATSVEPYGYYYNVLLDAFFERLKYTSEKDEKDTWIPDLLVVNLILDLRERSGYTFNKFEFIRDFEFEKLTEIYARANKKLKEDLNIKMNDHIQEQTLVRKMNHISLYMIKKMVDTKYVKRKKKRK